MVRINVRSSILWHKYLGDISTHTHTHIKEKGWKIDKRKNCLCPRLIHLFLVYVFIATRESFITRARRKMD